MVDTGVGSALPAVVAAALVEPPDGERIEVPAAGIPWSALTWGDPAARPLLMLHGVCSSAAVWWRVGPALAAVGHRIVAVDQPGHGWTGHWQGHHRFRDNAADVVAFARAAGLDRADVQVIGHSWGGLTAAALPVAGLRPSRLVLLDPPVLPFAIISQMVVDPGERHYDTFEEARPVVRGRNPDWSDGDVDAKAEALTQLDEEAARSVLLDNGDFDGGLGDLADPAADGIPIWLIRGDPDTGGLIPDPAADRFAARIGEDHVITLPGTPHSPQRTHPVETTAALLRALGDGAEA